MREIRIKLATTVLILVCIGIIMIYSASGIYALQELKDSAYFLKRHLLFFCIGLVLSFIVMSIDYRQLQKYAKPILIFSFILLVFVLIPGIGKESYGARRWFRLGMFNFQPSELMRMAIIIYVADYLSRKQTLMRNFSQGLFPILMVMGSACLLIIKQPDLGSTVSIAVIVMSMIFVAGARLFHVGLLFFSAIPVLVYLVLKEPYRMARIMAFLDPWQDSQGIGFQLTQSQIALGSGGLFGLGPGQSQQKLFYLPAAHTDFILSIIGEEFGLVGTLLVVVLFIYFLLQGLKIAHRSLDSFGYFLSIGILTMIGFQAAVNVGVSIGALPTKGLPLPFISYGGSALIFNMIAVALLLNISRIQDI